MNEFMNNLYNAVGSEVSGYHHDRAFHGVITHTRAKYGNDISVHVTDETDIYVIDGTELFAGEGSAYKNLHVYFK